MGDSEANTLMKNGIICTIENASSPCTVMLNGGSSSLRTGRDESGNGLSKGFVE